MCSNQQKNILIYCKDGSALLFSEMIYNIKIMSIYFIVYFRFCFMSRVYFEILYYNRHNGTSHALLLSNQKLLNKQYMRHVYISLTFSVLPIFLCLLQKMEKLVEREADQHAAEQQTASANNLFNRDIICQFCHSKIHVINF